MKPFSPVSGACSLLCLLALTGCLSLDSLSTDAEQEGSQDAAVNDASNEVLEASADGSSDAAKPTAQELTAACLERDRDPLLGLWHKAGHAKQQCEFFSNGHYTQHCGFGLNEAFEWALLDDGRYFFNATNAFGNPMDTCTAKPAYDKACNQVELTFSCEDGEKFEVKLVRDTD